jgi:uncharacterized membrane protein YfcA
MEISTTLFIILIITSFFTGILNAIAGGGGMLMVPVLLMAGVPPINAIAINKLQNTAGTLTSSLHYLRTGFLDLRSNWPALIFALITTCLGVSFLQHLSSTGKLEQVIPYLMIGIALYMALLPRVKKGQQNAKIPSWLFHSTIGSSAGFYGGLFGPGTGPMVISAFTAFRGYNLKQAVTNSKPMMVVINTTALTMLIFGGYVWWTLGLSMMIGNILGAYLGAGIMHRSKHKYLKLLMVAVPLISAIKLLFFI